MGRERGGGGGHGLLCYRGTALAACRRPAIGRGKPPDPAPDQSSAAGASHHMTSSWSRTQAYRIGINVIPISVFPRRPNWFGGSSRLLCPNQMTSFGSEKSSEGAAQSGRMSALFSHIHLLLPFFGCFSPSKYDVGLITTIVCQLASWVLFRLPDKPTLATCTPVIASVPWFSLNRCLLHGPSPVYHVLLWPSTALLT